MRIVSFIVSLFFIKQVLSASLINYTKNVNYVKDIVFDADTAWVATKLGVAKLFIDGTQFAYFPKNENGDYISVNDISISIDHTAYFATDKGLIVFKNNQMKTLTVDDGLLETNVLSVCANNDGTLWVGFSSGAMKFQNDEWTSYLEGDESISKNIQHITCGNIDTVYFGSVSRRATVFDGENWTRITSSEMQAYTVYDIAIDKDNTVWFGTNYGTYSFKDSVWTKYTNNNTYLETNTIYGVCVDDLNTKWFASDNVLCSYDGIEWKRHYYEYTFENKSVACDRNNNIWVGTTSGILIYDGENYERIILGPNGNYIKSIAEDSLNNIYLTSDGNTCLTKFNGTNWDFTPGTLFDLRVWTLQSLCYDISGNLWAGTVEGLLYINATDTVKYTTLDGLPDNHITAVFQSSDGKVWAGTASGCSYYENGKWNATALTNDPIRAFTEDRNGTVWCRSPWKIHQFDGDQWMSDSINVGVAQYSPTSSPDAGRSLISADISGNLWLPDWSRGVTLYKDQTEIILNQENGMRYNSSNAVAVDANNVAWVIGSTLHKCTEDTCVQIAHGIPKPSCIFIDKNGVKWIGTYGYGLFIYDDGGPGPYTPRIDTIQRDTVTLSLHKGWNLVSIRNIPRLAYPDILFPNAISIKTTNEFWRDDYSSEYCNLNFPLGLNAYIVENPIDETISIPGLALNPEPIVLKKGWNLVPTPIRQQESVKNVFSSIFDKLLTVMDESVFWDKNSNADLTLIPGKAYYINVSESCILIW